jgi:uncharacterized protein
MKKLIIISFLLLAGGYGFGQDNDSIKTYNDLKEVNYKNLLKSGEDYFNDNELKKSLTSYKKALELKNDNVYVKLQISRIWSKIFPWSIGFVNDFENILSKKERKKLLKKMKVHEKKTTNQIVIVTMSHLSIYNTLFEYSFDMAKHWGVGQKDKDNGVTIFVSKKLRKVRIRNGYGIEVKLSDEETKIIIDELMIPEFKKGNYYKGITKGVNEIIKKIK